jgi:hypothetical protein
MVETPSSCWSIVCSQLRLVRGVPHNVIPSSNSGLSPQTQPYHRCRLRSQTHSYLYDQRFVFAEISQTLNFDLGVRNDTIKPVTEQAKVPLVHGTCEQFR